MEIRRIQGGELPAAMDLCWRVFLKFEAPDYAPEGVEAFRAYLSDIEQVNHLTLFGAWEGDRSPCCGVNTTSDQDRELPGRGVFIASLRAALESAGLTVPVIGIKPSAPEALDRVRSLLGE